MAHSEHFEAKRIPLAVIARTFLAYGLLSFGGPAAHLALFERELVERRKWLSREHFLDLLAAINLIPGPNSTEMAFHIGLVTGGFWGSVLAGMGFIAPAVVFSIVLAVIYITAGQLPAVQGVLLGIKPVILVLILSAAYRLGIKAIDNTPMRIILLFALVVVALTVTPIMGIFGLNPVNIPELGMLLVTGALYVLYRRRGLIPIVAPPIFGLLLQVADSLKPTVLDLFARFFLIGATLFGSGYVLIAYMDRTFVQDTHWLTPQQLIDTVAIGQSTPGPLSSTAAAAGFIMTASPDDPLSGVVAAIASAVGVFLPAFLIILVLGRLVAYVRRYPAATDFLKGVNAGVIALLIGTFVNLAWGALVRPRLGLDWLSAGLTVLAFIALERLKWSPLLLIVIGIGVGQVRAAFGIL